MVSTYTLLKVVHILGVFLFLTATSITFYSAKVRGFKIVAGVSTMIILIAGLGLVVQLGEMPHWVWAKFAIWLVISVLGGIVAKRFLQYRTFAYILLIALASLAVFLVVHR